MVLYFLNSILSHYLSEVRYPGLQVHDLWAKGVLFKGIALEMVAGGDGEFPKVSAGSSLAEHFGTRSKMLPREKIGTEQ